MKETGVARAIDKFDLTGRVALVTGASSGLGWRFAKVLASQGARVVVAARRVDRLEALKAEIEADGGAAHAVALDVADRASIDAALAEARATFGPVQVLINNAGTATQTWALDVGPEEWRRVLGINLDGVWAMAQGAARQMIEAESGGAIVNIASVLGIGVSKTTGPYSVSKAGVIQMTRSLALEWARHNIRVNAIAPGYILTEINRAFLDSEAGRDMVRHIPQRRIGRPEDLDGVLLLLASDASAFMTGSLVVADGGQILDIA